MKMNVAGSLALAAAPALAMSVRARPGQDVHPVAPIPRANTRPASNQKRPVKLVGAILLPGNPLRFDINWVDQATTRYYLAEGRNRSVDAIDAAAGALLDSLPAGPGGRSVAAYRGNNHVFVPIASPNAVSPTNACAAMFGLPGKQGCIAVYAHEK